MKVISLSLWGSNPTYTIGAIKNAVIASTLFPDWVCVYYCFDSVPLSILDRLNVMENVKIRMVSDSHDMLDNRGMFHRFLPADETGVEYMICRDTDSRLSERERYAVDEWLGGGADLHLMRDHPYHGVPILGGMWGVRGGRLKQIRDQIRSFCPTKAKGQDQVFLKDWIWPKVIRGELSAMIHDPFFFKHSFPSEAKRGIDNGGVWFVGQVFDEFDRVVNQSDIDILVNAESERYKFDK